MDIDELKIFLYGLPLDSQENTLKDFLEAVVDYPGGVTQVNIPSKKKFAFVTVSHTVVAKSLLRSTLLYCDDDGQLYHLKACPYVKQPRKQKEFQEFKPKTKVNATIVIRESKPTKYTPPDHVHQFTPDYGMLSLSKPKRKRKRDESAIWFSGINGTASSRKKPRHKKKKKQISKLDYHKSESFQFGLLCPRRKCAISNVENITDSTGVVDPGLHEKDQALKKADEADAAVEATHEDDHKATKYSSSTGSHTQVIIDHEYLGPLCLQFTSPPSIADVKNEVMERTGLPVKDQILYNNGRKLCDSVSLRSLLDGDLESVSLLLFAGSLKGGVPPKRDSQEGAAEGKEIRHSSQEEGATGFRDDLLSQEATPLMETWDVKTTALWLSQIGLIKKYCDICEKEEINGRALLLLASKSPDKLVSIFQFKTGPKTILIDNLEQHLKAFDTVKPQTMWNSKKTFGAWTEKDVCNWLKELHIPEACLKVAEEEEINGQAFSILRKSGNLKNVLQLKEGSWVVLEHELSLQLENTETVKSGELSADKTSLSLPEDDSREVEKSKAPFAANAPSVRNDFETLKNVSLSREEKRLSLLQSALKLDIVVSKGSEKNECVVRSIFVKRGKAANALEKMFNFIVITKEEMTGDKPRRLWSKIRSKAADWLKLLPATDSQLFLRGGASHSFVHRPTGEKVSLREDGKVGQIFLEKLSESEYKESQFMVLVDKQLLEEKKTLYTFSFDKKHKCSYNIKLSVKESNYHASFDANSPGQDFKWSKHVQPLMNKSDDLKKTVSDPHSDELKLLSTNTELRKQAPRPFTSEFGGKYYLEGSILDSWETGSKDLINPAREFKLLRGGGTNAEDDCIEKFVYETLRFACGCLNERTNGTIHFGVADEVGDQACGYKPKEIVGCSVPDKPCYKEKLTEFIGKCFVGESRSNVHNCIRPPVFIPVQASAAEQHPKSTVVIEVDIEPRHSVCAKEIFKVGFTCLDRGREKEAAYIRRGSETVAILEANEMEVYMNRRPKLDEERKRREGETNIFQGMEKQDSIKFLHDKLKRLLCANKKVLDSSVYPILVLSKPEASMNQDFLETMFRFIQNVKWEVIVDFDDQASDTSGLCSVYKSGPDAAPCDIHEAEDYDGDDNLIESIDIKTHWIFGNGYAKLHKEAVGFKQWNNSRRKRGLSLVIQSLAKKIPFARAVVLFLLFSKDYETLADTFKDFCTYLDGPNQLAYVAENSEIVKDWESKLSSTCLEEHELRERGVVGMSWSEFRECMQQMISGIDRHQCYVIMASGSPHPLKNACFSNIEIVSAKECEELRSLSSSERLEISRKEELAFYRGYSVTWRNFWFTDDRKNHVLRRDNYSQLKALIQKIHSRGHEGKVQTLTIYHHIGAGASTMARQALWDFRCNEEFPYRCAVVTKVDNSTCEELLLLRKIGYEDNSKFSSCPPVLALVEDTDDFLFREFRSQVVELAYKLSRTESPVCVFLYCKETQNPYECHSKERETSVSLEQNLSQREIDWFKDKYTEMKGKFHHKDPEQDFETYASEKLISFMIMKENFNQLYVSSVVERNLNQVTNDELTLLEYTSLLSVYNPYPIFVSCFDTLMLSVSLLKRRIYRDWLEDLTHSARIFLREEDVSTHLGTGKAITVVHPIIASEILDRIAERKKTTVSQIVLDFLESPLLENQGKSFTATYLYDGANRMLKRRKKYDYGDDVQTKFAPLIEKILYVKDVEGGKREPTEGSIYQAADVLSKGLEKFNDPTLAQQMARVFYVNAEFFQSNSEIDSCFNKALEYCQMAIKMSPNNSFLFDTMGRIYESKIKILFGPIRKDNRVIEIEAVTPVLPLACTAMMWFQKSMSVSADYQNNSGFRGELSVMFYLLDVLRCARIFRGKEGLKRLQRYVAFCQVIPPQVQEPWSDYHVGMKELRNRFSHCMEGLTEDFTVFKGNKLEEKMVPKQIASYKAQYHSYFGEGEINWNSESAEERWQHRWYKINQFLAGGIFKSVFSLYATEGTPRETLEKIKKLAIENYQEPVKENYNDLLLIVATRMALHSPYSERPECKPAKSDHIAEEYRETYKFVEKLFAMEECDDGHKRIYAHLLKVMFLWPREDLELSSYRVHEFYDTLQKLKERWGRKDKEHYDVDKMLKQKMYKHMSFRRDKRQYTTLFYLGEGCGLNVFVHINELNELSAQSLDWEKFQVKRRLKRLTGMVESKNVIRVQNPLEANRTIDIYYSPFREGGFSKEEVSFYLGFSWAHLIAFDVKYTNKDNRKHSVELSDAVSDDSLKFVPKYGIVTYEQYTWRLKKLTRTLKEIDAYKKSREEGKELEENQIKKLQTENEVRDELEELKTSFAALSELEEDIFDKS